MANSSSIEVSAEEVPVNSSLELHLRYLTYPRSRSRRDTAHVHQNLLQSTINKFLRNLLKVIFMMYTELAIYRRKDSCSGSFVSAPSDGCSANVMVGSGISLFAMFSISNHMDEAQVPAFFNYLVKKSSMVPILITLAFNGSFIGLIMNQKLPQLATYCGYVSLFSLLSALSIIAFFTGIWAFQRI